MPYIQWNQKQVDDFIEKRKRQKDKYGVDWYMATETVQAIFGKKGIATFYHRFTSKDPVGPDNYVIPLGERFQYGIGYERKGKRGNILHTMWQGESYVDAFLDLYEDYKKKNAKQLPKLKEVLVKYMC